MARRRAVFLDRDGVLNKPIVRDGRPFPPDTVADLEILPGVAAACRVMADAGLLLIGVTNQPDVARGSRTTADIRAINDSLRRRLRLDDIRVCPHDDGHDCDCRKPRPGMLVEAARDFDIDLITSIMVGDRWRDIEAGKAAGCRTVFIDYGYTERRPDGANFECNGLPDAVPWILKAIAEP